MRRSRPGVGDRVDSNALLVTDTSARQLTIDSDRRARRAARNADNVRRCRARGHVNHHEWRCMRKLCVSGDAQHTVFSGAGGDR